MAMTFISTNSPSGADNSAFTGLDNTYRLYIFKFASINPGTNEGTFTFNGSDDTSSHAYNIIKTTTLFLGQNTAYGADSGGSLTYHTGFDKAQSTDYQAISQADCDDAEHCYNGELFLFNPSNTTYVTNFYSRSSSTYADGSGDTNYDVFVSGYFNTTAAITAIDFKQSSGTITGTISLYGVAIS